MVKPLAAAHLPLLQARAWNAAAQQEWPKGRDPRSAVLGHLIWNLIGQSLCCFDSMVADGERPLHQKVS